MKTMYKTHILKFVSVVLLTLLSAFPQAKAQQIDFTLLREKLFARQTGIPYNENSGIIKNQLQKMSNSATKSWNTLIKNNDRTTLWSDITFSSSADITEAYSRLQSLAMSTVLPGSAYYNNQSLKADIIAALDWLYAHKYNENIVSWDNWWDFRIGTPQRLNPIVILLYNDLSQTQINNYMNAVKFHCNDIAHYTAANLAWIVNVIGTRAIIIGDEERLLYARNSLIPAIKNEISGDGFYDDGSFIQHDRHPYNGGYGISFISSVIQVMQIFEGTSYAIPEDKKDIVLNWLYKGYEPMIYNGGLFAYVRGREISRSNISDNSRGRGMVQVILRFREMIGTEDQNRLNSLMKYILTKDDTYSSPYDGTTDITALIEMEKIVTNTAIQARSGYEIYHQYAAMDRVVQQRPKYAFGVAMHSSRIYNYEMLNEENKRGWFTASGTTYIYNGEGGQYAQNYWPTVDAYKMPGTTVANSMTYARNKTTQSDFVGGVELLKKYGVTCMYFDAQTNLSVKARKSWFMFDNEIVALGSDITTSRAIGGVNTYIEQRRLSSDNRNTFVVDGTKQAAVLGEDEPTTLSSVTWAHLTGKYTNSDTSIGYYFPTPVNLKATRKQQTGKWSEINKSGSSSEQKNYFLTLWKEHNNHSLNTESDYNKYDYVILPAMAQNDVKNYAANPDIEIIENTAGIHAVTEKKLGITGAIFWEESNQQKVRLNESGYLYCDKKAAIIYQRANDSIIISICDPTQTNKGKIRVTLQNIEALGILEANENIVVKSLFPSIELEVDVDGARGKTRQIVFSARDISSIDMTDKELPVYARFNDKELYISFVSVGDIPAIISLYNLQGQKIVEQEFSTLEGHNEYKLTPHTVIPGVYILILKHGNQSYKLKLIK